MIKIQNVSKEIDGKLILNNISLNIERGKVFSLIGPNGAGKTTLVRTILNLYEATSGNIFINGVNVRDKDFKTEKYKISVILDDIGIFNNLTARENLEFFDRIYNSHKEKDVRDKKIVELLDLVGLDQEIDLKPTFFSRGMKQRLAIARALISEPYLLIMDEPMRGLDVEGQRLIRNIIDKLKDHGVTIFLNSHNMNQIEKVADQIAFIKGGQIIDFGNKDCLLRKYKMDSLEDLYVDLILENELAI